MGSPGFDRRKVGVNFSQESAIQSEKTTQYKMYAWPLRAISYKHHESGDETLKPLSNQGLSCFMGVDNLVFKIA